MHLITMYKMGFMGIFVCLNMLYTRVDLWCSRL